MRVTRETEGVGSVTRRPRPAGLLERIGNACVSGGGVGGKLTLHGVEVRVLRVRGAGGMGTTKAAHMRSDDKHATQVTVD